MPLSEMVASSAGAMASLMRWQALTIIGLGTAWTNVRLMLFAIWPFTQGIRDTVRTSWHSGSSGAHSLAQRPAHDTSSSFPRLLTSWANSMKLPSTSCKQET